MYKARLTLRMNYKGSTTGALELLTNDDVEDVVNKIDLRCIIDSELDALVAFIDANIFPPTDVEALTARNNYEYDIIREIADNTELSSLLSLLGNLSQE